MTDASQPVSSPSTSPRHAGSSEFGRRRGGSAAQYLLSRR